MKNIFFYQPVYFVCSHRYDFFNENNVWTYTGLVRRSVAGCRK